MKTNAIIRIVIWILVISILSTLLFLGLGIDRSFDPFTSSTHSSSGSTIPTSPVQTNGTVTQDSAAPAPAMDGAVLFDPSQITDISIEWVSGSILLIPEDREDICISEMGDTGKYQMNWKIRDRELSIDFCEESLMQGFGIHFDSSKDLTIHVPTDWICNELELDAGAATLKVRDMNIRSVEIDTASGTCDFENCTVGSLDIDTASGDVTFTGILNELDCDAASASFRGILDNTPSRISMDSMSGDLDLTLPEDAGFTVSMDAMSSDFSSDFDTVSRNGSHIHGDGRCRINMDAMSGDVILRRAGGFVPSSPTAPTVETTAAAGAGTCPIPDHVHSEHCYEAGSTCPDPHHTHTDTCHRDQIHHEEKEKHHS